MSNDPTRLTKAIVCQMGRWTRAAAREAMGRPCRGKSIVKLAAETMMVGLSSLRRNSGRLSKAYRSVNINCTDSIN